MHDKHNELYERIVKRTFGPTAEYTGAMGSAIEPGTARILLDGRVIGTGGTFQEALNNAHAALGTRERPLVSEPASQTA